MTGLIFAMLIGIHGNIIQEPQLIRTTCYIATGNKTASGVYPKEGMIAGRKEDIGKTAILYDKDMNYIGMFEITDTGGKPIRSGKVIDVYRDNIERVYEWSEEYGDYTYVQIIDCEG